MEILKKFWQSWKRVGQFIGDQIARVFLTLFYFTIFMPFGLGVRIWGDPLSLRTSYRAQWLERRTHDLTLKDAWRLF